VAAVGPNSLENILLLAARSGRKATSGKRAGQDVKFRNPKNPDET
jgi:hypothetical protein